MANGQVERRAPTPVAFTPGAKIALLGLILTLLLNMGALIWGAATMNAAVSYGAQERRAIATQLSNVAMTLNALEIRVARMETKLEEHDRRESVQHP